MTAPTPIEKAPASPAPASEQPPLEGGAAPASPLPADPVEVAPAAPPPDAPPVPEGGGYAADGAGGSPNAGTTVNSITAPTSHFIQPMRRLLCGEPQAYAR